MSLPHTSAVELLGGELRGALGDWAGESLLGFLAEGRATRTPRVFAQRRPLRKTGGDGVYALQSERHKLILRATGADEFYDLESDPLELRNQAGAETAAEAELRGELEGWLRAFADRGLESEAGEEQWRDELQKLGYAE